MRLAAVIFDLDGTLVDSRADLAAAANHVRIALGRPTLPAEVVLGFVGDGARMLLRRTLAHVDDPIRPPAAPSEADIDQAYAIFAAHYSAHLLDHTVLYPGMAELLRRLAPRPLFLATNKPREFTLPLVNGLGLGDVFAAVVAGDDVERRKPHPDHLLSCLAGFDLDPTACAMVGDSPNDILPARDLGMRSVALTWGLVEEDRLAAAGPDHLVHDAAGLAAALQSD